MFESLKAQVTPLLGGLEPKDLVENDEHQRCDILGQRNLAVKAEDTVIHNLPSARSKDGDSGFCFLRTLSSTISANINVLLSLGFGSLSSKLLLMLNRAPLQNVRSAI